MQCCFVIAVILAIVVPAHCGNTDTHSQPLGHVKMEWGSETYTNWREIAWNDMQRHSRFVRRAIRGACGARNYTYFRPEANYEGMSSATPWQSSWPRRKTFEEFLHCTCARTNRTLSDILERNIMEARNEPNSAPQWGVHTQEDLMKAVIGTPPWPRG